MLKKVFKDKRAVLVVSFLALFSLVLLATAIRDVTFRPARHLTGGESQVIGVRFGPLIESIANIPVERQIAFFVMLFLFGVLIMLLLTPEMRKRLLKQLLRLALGALLFFYLLKLKPNLLEEFLPVLDATAGQSAPSQVDAVPPPVFEPPQISGWVSFLVTLGIVLLTTFLVWRVNRWWQFLNPAAKSPSPLDEITKAARASLRNLSSEGPVRDKIIQCYADMSRVVDARRGLFREYAMTPAEFALRLEDAGLPREPVSRLTRLFEAVRYGARTSTQGDVDEAIMCLKSILKYCGEVV